MPVKYQKQSSSGSSILSFPGFTTYRGIRLPEKENPSDSPDRSEKIILLAFELIVCLKRGEETMVLEKTCEINSQILFEAVNGLDRAKSLLVSVARQILTCMHLHRGRRPKWISGANRRFEEEVERRKDASSLCMLFEECVSELGTGVMRMRKSAGLVSRTSSFIDRNFHRKTTVMEFSGSVGLSVSCVMHGLKREGGRTFMQMLNARRMEEAKFLLSSTRLLISRIAEKCGFAQQGYFSKTFLKSTGVAPRDYRRAHSTMKGRAKTVGKSARLILTGGAGFIGSNLLKALNGRGYNDIIVVDHVDDVHKVYNLDGVKFSDLIDKSDFRKMLLEGRAPEARGVFHLGACSSTTETDESYLLDNNFNYTRDVCIWSLEQKARFVYASSAATYGDGSLGYCDQDKISKLLKPLNPYGRSKQMFDLWALKTGAARRIAGLKYFNVYGPGEDHKGDMRSLVNKSYEQVIREGRIRLFKSYRPDYRDGEQERDFIYVDDAVSVTLFLFDHPEVCGIFNCGTGKARTWIDLAKAIFIAMGRTPDIEFIDMPESIRDRYQYHTQADITKLVTAGYSTPFLAIEEGVRRYIQNYLACKS